MIKKQTAAKKSIRKQRMSFRGVRVRAGHEDGFLINMSDVQSGHIIILQLAEQFLEEVDYIARYYRMSRNDWLKSEFLDSVRRAKEGIYNRADMCFNLDLITAEDYKQIKGHEISPSDLKAKKAAHKAVKKMIEGIRMQVT
jgi:hypothetical protein